MQPNSGTDREFIEYRFNDLKDTINDLKDSINKLNESTEKKLSALDKRVIALEKFSWQTVAIASVVIVIATLAATFLRGKL